MSIILIIKNIRRLCDENKILLIIDDVFCGFGRTGKMFSFEHENIIPDIFTVSKSLGGGKSSIAAYITKDKIYNRHFSLIRPSGEKSSGMGLAFAKHVIALHNGEIQLEPSSQEMNGANFRVSFPKH